jgi:hypothetical protein
VSPSARVRAAEIAVAAAFAAAAAWLFVEGDARNGSLPFFLAWLGVHVLYGAANGSFWSLLIAVTCPPLFVAASSSDWLEAAFVGAFYGVPLTFIGVVARRIWRLRRLAAALPDESEGETLRE